MIEVTCKVRIYDIGGKASVPANDSVLIVSSHWNQENMVVLRIGEKEYTVSKRDLEAAISNAVNSNRFG